jgi:hypothetical protein
MRICFWIAPALFAASLCLSAPAADWGPLFRAQALEQAKSGQTDKRGGDGWSDVVEHGVT